MTDLDKMARNLLAAEHRRRGSHLHADRIIADTTARENSALAAIRAALLHAPPGYVLVERAQLESALDSVRSTMESAYHRHFPECCGSYSPDGCCGNPREAWSKEDHETMGALGPAEKALSAMLAAAPEVK